jgi:ligand-binding sensor domain-containing protein/signal transduction histidine kinase/DNA-binding response OmpR family regulator
MFILLGWWHGSLVAQDILFTSYTVADGLCSNTVTTIAQDDQGFMWFGTKGGLNRFDGYEFRQFQHTTDSFSIGENFIRVIYQLNGEAFLIGTDQGIYEFDIKTERFSRFLPSVTSKVNDITKDRDGNLWIASTRGVYIFQKQENDSWQESAHYGLNVEIRSMVCDRSGKLWLGTYGKGIMVYDPEVSAFTHHRADESPEALKANYILTLYQSMEGVVWAGTLTGGLCYWDEQQGQFVNYMHEAGKNSISSNIVRTIAQRKPGELLIGTEKGLNVLDIAHQHFSVHSSSNYDSRSLNDNAVWSIYVDKQENLWLGTYFGGVNFANMAKAKFDYYYPSAPSSSLKGKAVSAFLEDNNNLWVATEDAGLHYFNVKENKFYQFPFQPNQQALSYYNIHALLKDHRERLWIGTFTGGLDVFDLTTGKVKNYTNRSDDRTSLSNNSIYSLLQDRAGMVWVGTIKGLNRYDAEQDAFVRVTEDGLGSSVIYGMIEDEKGNLWVPTYGNGLYVKEADTQIWNHFPIENSGDKIISLCEDQRGRIWIGTEGNGLSCYEQGKFKHYNKEAGVPINTIYSIVNDEAGNLWMSSNQGIFCYHPDTGRKIHFKNWDYLQSNQFNYGAGIRASNGVIYFGGINGFNAFQPDSLLQYYNHREFDIYITDFQLYNHPVAIDPENGKLTQAMNYSEHIELDHDQSVVSFEYAAIDYVASGALTYAYKMEGFDDHWNYVGNQRRATYTNLPPGDYVFKVKATKDEGGEMESVNAVHVSILPPFYRTPVAYASYLACMIILFIVLRKRAVQQAEKRNLEKLEQLKRREERAFYKRKIEFFTEMAHEIRTPLSLIMAPLERLLASRNKVDPATQEQLQVMQDNSEQLSSLINQLMDFRRIESEHYTITPEKTELVHLVQSIYSRFLGISYQKDVKFSFSTDTDQLVVMVDPEALTKILNNLLINAFKFARNQVSVEITTASNDSDKSSYFSINIMDDGIGIPNKDLNHIFDKFFKVTSGSYQYNNLGGAGIGLFLAKSLSEMHGGRLKVDSQPNAYTKFCVEIPYKQSASEAEERPYLQVHPDASEEIDENAPKLLVVEDNPSLLNFLVDSFREKKYGVYAASNGKEAVEILAEQPVDIVLTDVMMPEMDGLELCKYIKSNINVRQIPVVLLTAKSDPETEMDGLEIGADAFVVKPFKFKHLDLVVKNLLDTRTLLKLKFSQHPLSEADAITRNAKDKKFVNRIIARIEDNISNSEFSVSELSEALGISRSGLHKRLKNISGLGPNQFIKLIRLKHAARMLKQGNYNISEVGYLSGFSSPSYFSKCFNQQFNMSPKDFIINETDQGERKLGS